MPTHVEQNDNGKFSRFSVLYSQALKSMKMQSFRATDKFVTVFQVVF